MKRNHKNNRKHAGRMELKYCEHCGSLWLRASGSGTVYCEKCQPKVAELPPPCKKNPGRIQLPLARHAVIERYGEADQKFLEIESDEFDLEAAGGVA
jgi:hypothetical protein